RLLALPASIRPGHQTAIYPVKQHQTLSKYLFSNPLACPMGLVDPHHEPPVPARSLQVGASSLRCGIVTSPGDRAHSCIHEVHAVLVGRQSYAVVVKQGGDDD